MESPPNGQIEISPAKPKAQKKTSPTKSKVEKTTPTKPNKDKATPTDAKDLGDDYLLAWSLARQYLASKSPLDWEMILQDTGAPTKNVCIIP